MQEKVIETRREKRERKQKNMCCLRKLKCVNTTDSIEFPVVIL